MNDVQMSDSHTPRSSNPGRGKKGKPKLGLQIPKPDHQSRVFRPTGEFQAIPLPRNIEWPRIKPIEGSFNNKGQPLSPKKAEREKSIQKHFETCRRVLDNVQKMNKLLRIDRQCCTNKPYRDRMLNIYRDELDAISIKADQKLFERSNKFLEGIGNGTIRKENLESKMQAFMLDQMKIISVRKKDKWESYKKRSYLVKKSWELTVQCGKTLSAATRNAEWLSNAYLGLRNPPQNFVLDTYADILDRVQSMIVNLYRARIVLNIRICVEMGKIWDSIMQPGQDIDLCDWPSAFIEYNELIGLQAKLAKRCEDILKGMEEGPTVNGETLLSQAIRGLGEMLNNKKMTLTEDLGITGKEGFLVFPRQ